MTAAPGESTTGPSHRRGPLRRLESLTSALERPVRRVVGSGRLNPLPHAGTISVFLLLIVTITGVYLTFFFQFGYRGSYGAVAAMEGNPIQRIVRGVHRYASAALVLTTLVHGWRVFVMARFSGPRRWRWLTGTLALLVVWLAGVTGYWLIWDVRAQALWEATGRLVGTVSGRLQVAFATFEGSGWGTFFTLWTAHLLLTGLVAWALWRHLRHTRHRWFPPRRWMWMMGGALVVASAILPAGMLPAADPTRIPGAMPLDPFVMFLLPPLSARPLLTVAIGIPLATLAVVLPWLMRRHRIVPVVSIVDDRCTGCELCVVDCPYLALTMSDDGDRAVAVVDPQRCVGCGICLGSCAFAAITGLDTDPVPPAIEGPVALVCSRLVDLGHTVPDVGVIRVRCTGVVDPRTLTALRNAGAEDVRMVGCPPGDCVYGVGNLLASERLTGTRRPHAAPRDRRLVSQDWVSPSELAGALSQPGRHPAADLESSPGHRRFLVAAAAVVAVSVVGVRLATDARYGADPVDAGVRVVVEHRAGAILEGADVATGGFPAAVAVTVDGRLVTDHRLADDGVASSGVVDVVTSPGTRDVRVVLSEGDRTSVLFDGSVSLAAGDRLVVSARDTPLTTAANAGRDLFEGEGLGASLGCGICHSLRPGQDGVGPSLAGVADRASGRVPGVSAADYLRQSIVDPDAFVVPGYRPGQMLPIYGERLTSDQVDELVAFLLTLTAGSSP